MKNTNKQYVNVSSIETIKLVESTKFKFVRLKQPANPVIRFLCKEKRKPYFSYLSYNYVEYYVTADAPEEELTELAEIISEDRCKSVSYDSVSKEFMEHACLIIETQTRLHILSAKSLSEEDERALKELYESILNNNIKWIDIKEWY
ncbi:MAG: hypothetical protein ACRDD8_03905 [Bacteroidales bacterium]